MNEPVTAPVGRADVVGPAAREPQHAPERASWGGRQVSVQRGASQAPVSVRTRAASAGTAGTAGTRRGTGRSLLTRLITALRSPFHGSAKLRGNGQDGTASSRGPGQRPGGPGAPPQAGRAAAAPRSAVPQESPVPVGERATLAAGSVVALGNYLVNRSVEGAIPQALQEDLQTVVRAAGQVDADLERAVELLDASGQRPLNDGEQRELSSLVLSNKHNLVLLQTWLADRTGQPEGENALTPEARTLGQALQDRFADRLMDLADLMCRHDLEEPFDEPVSRSARAGAHLRHASAAVAVAKDLDVPGLDPQARQRLVDELQAHRDELAAIKGAASGRMEAPAGELKLAARELWETPVALVKPKKGGADELQQLRARWDSSDVSGQRPLPAAHAKVGQARMLQEFVAHRLAQAGVAKRDIPALKAAHQEAYLRTVNEQPWDPIAKRVRTTLPNSDGKRTVVESRIVPSKAMAAHFAEDYVANGINCADRTQYKHVPNLAQTSATNASGRILFSGLRHGVIDAYEIDGKFLARLPEARLRTMVGDLLVRDGGGQTPGTAREQRIADLVAGIRSDPAQAARSAEAMRVQASHDMAREMATAALVSDPEKFRRACDGETVDLELSSISLLTPDALRHAQGKLAGDEKTMLRHQTAALEELGGGGPVELPVRDDAGQARTVTANVRVRQFNFGVNAGAVQGIKAGPVSIPAGAPVLRHLMGWGFAMANNDPHLGRLLGPSGASELGGDIVAKVRSMSERAAQLGEARTRLDRQMQEDGPEHPDSAARRSELAALPGEMDGLERDARTLVEAGTQLKSIWANREYRRGGGDPYKMVSRLALVSHLMGETPLFNCKSGKDRTGQLDAEVKFLATVADERGGHLPPVDADMARWRAARSDFTMNTGNLEMQQLNTGLPGYKLAGVSGLANMIADDMKPVYRGGSAYTAS